MSTFEPFLYSLVRFNKLVSNTAINCAKFINVNDVRCKQSDDSIRKKLDMGVSDFSKINNKKMLMALST